MSEQLRDQSFAARPTVAPAAGLTEPWERRHWTPWTYHRGPGDYWGVFDMAGGLVAQVTDERDADLIVSLANEWARPKSDG